MCRYGLRDYRTHWACVDDRYTVKAPRRYGSSSGVGPPCPRCGRQMVDLGRDFHAPRRRDVREWRKVALLVSSGIRFDSCGCTGPGPRPRTLADARSELGRRRADRRASASRRRVVIGRR